MARTWKYVGPSDEVEVVRDGVPLGVVKRNGLLEIEDPAASKSLEGSPDWEVQAGKKSPAAKKAAETRATDEAAPAAETTED